MTSTTNSQPMPTSRAHQTQWYTSEIAIIFTPFISVLLFLAKNSGPQPAKEWQDSGTKISQCHVFTVLPENTYKQSSVTTVCSRSNDVYTERLACMVPAQVVNRVILTNLHHLKQSALRKRKKKKKVSQYMQEVSNRYFFTATKIWL